MNILVHKHNLEIAKAPVNEREINVSKITFTFDEDLSNYTKEAYFTLNGNSYKILLTSDECYIPSEALSEYGELEIGVVAFLVENDTEIKRYNPSPVYINTLVGSLKEAENSEPITPTDKEQIEQALNDGLDAIDNAISQVNTAIQETNNLNLDANKVGKEATITLTKKDGTQKIVKIEDGVSLQFMWQGTSLGIKTDDMDEYVFVNLQGIQGPMGPQGQPFQIKKTYPTIQAMVDDYDNMQVNDYVMISGSIEQQDNATLWVKTETQAPTYKWVYLADFSGASGIQGPPGPTPNIQIGSVTSGDTPSVTRSGTDENPIFDFVLQPGPQGQEGQTGPTGNGISNIEKTNETPSQRDYRINYTNGGHFDYSVLNGEVTKSQLEMLENALPHVSGTGTSITLNNTAQYPMKNVLNPSELSQETTTGKNYFNIDKVLTNYNTSGVKNNNDGTLLVTTSSGSTSAAALSPNKLSDYCPTLQVGDVVYLNANSTGTNKFIYLGTSASIWNFGTIRTITQNDLDSLVYWYASGISTSATISNIMVSTTGGDYEPYTGGIPQPNPTYPSDIHVISGDNSIVVSNSDNTLSQVKPLNLGDIEYCKMGTNKDNFFKAIDGDSIYDTLDSTTKASLTDGKWYIQKNIGKVVLDGTQSTSNFSKNTNLSTTDYNCFFYQVNDIAKAPNDTTICVMSDKFIGTPSNERTYNKLNCWENHLSSGNMGMHVSNTITTESGLVNWFSTNISTFYHWLANPTYILLNDTLQSELDDIYNTMLSYQGQTNVSQVNNDLPFNMSSRTLKDISNL